MIFAQGDISAPMQPVFNRPVRAQERGNGLWASLGRRQIGEAVDDLLAGFFDLLALLGSLGLLDGLCLLPLLGGWGLLDEFRAFAFDSSEDLKGLGHPCPLASKPLMHLGGGAHRAGGESSLSFFGRRKDVPRALIRLRVLEKQRQIFPAGGGITFQKEGPFLPTCFIARACELSAMPAVRGPHPMRRSAS